MKTFSYLWVLTLVVVLAACSSEQNSVTGNVYHNLTAHFNGYYYAAEKAREVEYLILQSLDDDHNQILRLFPKLDTVLAKTYEKETEEIVKMASISIQRHPNSKWVDDNYIMVGLARLYDCDFHNAVQTFKYVNTKSSNSDTRHQALIHLVRTFTEQGDYPKAEEAFHFLEKENLSKQNSKELYLGKAYYYQVREDYDNMVRNLAQADSLFNRKDRKGRIYFIIGQVYQKLGFGSEAYNYYRKCLGTNPEYEIDFYARLNMAQVARLDDTRDVSTVRKQFKRMLDDAKNLEFRDKIYYELGEFERKQNNLKESITNYTLAAHAGTNKRIQGSSYLRMGQLHFDSLRKYSLAKHYYDSAVNALPPDFENLDAIKKRKDLLGEFATHTETIQWQDSLLHLASFDSLTLKTMLDSAVASRQQQEELSKKKKRRNGNGGNNNSNSPFFLTESTATADWYFGNPSAVAGGQTEFQRIWGAVPLEDNWRRSNKTSLVQPDIDLALTSNEPSSTEDDNATEQSTDEVDRIFSELPLTESAKREALAKIENAYFHLGDLFYLQLNEKENAIDAYQTVLRRFPGSEFEPEILYKLYLISKEKKDGTSETYARQLTENHPNSTYTKILINPDFLKETSIAAEKQKAIYKEAFSNYEAGNIKRSQVLLNEALALGETGFISQLALLHIMITGKTQDVTVYQAELEDFLVQYPDDVLKPFAERLLESTKTFQQKAGTSGIRYTTDLDEVHYFVLAYPYQTSSTTRQISASIENFIRRHFRNEKLITSNLILNDTYMMTMVSEFPELTSATEFHDKFNLQTIDDPVLSNFKFDTFVITKTNSDILYRTKALNEYLAFFDRNYKVKNQ